MGERGTFSDSLVSDIILSVSEGYTYYLFLLNTDRIAANLGQCKSFKVKLSRRDYCRIDVVEVW